MHLFLSLQTVTRNGLFQKISTHTLWTTPNWVPKNFRISKKHSRSLRRIPNPADSNSWGIPEFCKILKGFAGISVKNSQNFRKTRGIPVRLTEHLLQDFQCRPWGCVDIVWNSPMQDSVSVRLKVESFPSELTSSDKYPFIGSFEYH